MDDVVDEVARAMVQELEPEELGYFDEIKAEMGKNYKPIKENILQMGEIPELAWTAIAVVAANEVVQELSKILIAEFKIGAGEVAKAIRQFLTKKATGLIADGKTISLSKEKIDRIVENALTAARKTGCTGEQVQRLEKSLRGSFARAKA